MGGKAFYNKITWFSFAFSLLVVWIHSYNAELFLGKTAEMERIYQIEHWIGDGIGQIAVPGFFMISGYLFYRDFSWEKLRGKWQRRIHSVLVPYIAWNFLYYLGYVIGSHLPWVSQVVGKGVIRLSLSASVDAIINYTYNYVFWYLYQLILLILLAPVLYPLLKRWWSRGMFLAVLWILAALDLRLPQVNVDALIYYSTAASLALSWAERKRRRNAPAEQDAEAARRETEARREVKDQSIERARREAAEQIAGVQQENRRKNAWTGAVMVAGAWAAWRLGMSFGLAVCFVLCRLLAVCGLWLAVPEEALPEAGETVRNNFFLYATHFAFVRFFNKAGAMLLPAYPAVPLILYLAMPFLVLGVSTGAGRLLRRHAPSVWTVLNGGR